MSKKKRVQQDSDSGLTVNRELDFRIKIKCKSEKQKEFLEALGDEKNEIVFGYGSAGVGKTYVALSEALAEVKSGKYEKIIFITPTAEAGSRATNLGLLPGTVGDKVFPYIENLKDTTKKILKFSGNYDYDEMAGYLFKDGKIEVKLMNYARGTTYDNAIVIIDEGENFNRGEFLLLLTRMGENTRYFIIGSEQQCDRMDIRREGGSGMMYALKRLEGLPEVKSIEFTDEDVVRNPLIGKILKAWE